MKLNCNDKIYIFGAGVFGKNLYLLLKLSRISVAGFLDNDPIKWGMEIVGGIVCQNPQVLKPADNILIIIAIQNEPKIIAEDLQCRGFRHIYRMNEIEQDLRSSVNKLIDDIGVDLVNYMAQSGEGTDKCLEAGCLPVPVHFYQPIPDIKDLERKNIWDKKSNMDGIDWLPEKYIENMKDISKHQPCTPWRNASTGDNMHFTLDNPSFSYLCASFLYGMINKYRPKCIIEIGSGNSSKVIRQAMIDSAITEGYTIVDPYCNMDKSQFVPIEVDICKLPVEETELVLYKTLKSGDILFIDSSHSVHIGGDVNFEILEILPMLNSGVIIHFHDIPMPYEYEKVYAVNPQFRVFWTESYLLQAFLMYNNDFEILLPGAYVCKEHKDIIEKLFPCVFETSNWVTGSFWMRKK
jgi:hypothetical protein